MHAALRGSTGPRGVYRAWTVVSVGVLSFLLSILPLLLALASPPAAVLWRSASAIGLAGMGASAYSLIVLDHQMTRLGHPPQTTSRIRLAQALSVVAVLAMLLNLIGWPWAPGPLAYGTALTLVLCTGLVALLQSFLVPLEIVLGGKHPA